jgi:hypothetical protein
VTGGNLRPFKAEWESTLKRGRRAQSVVAEVTGAGGGRVP